MSTQPMNPQDEDKMISDVNAKYNSLITYKTQQSDDGKSTGGWQLDNLPDGGEGDCDTFARTKGEALAAQGFPKDKLAIVTAKMWNGVDHAVLRVDRGNGKFVYLSNPLNAVQKQNPDSSILDDLPGKPEGVEMGYDMWEIFRQLQQERQKLIRGEQ